MEDLLKPAHYEVEHAEVVENWDQDQYGNTWYTVKFRGLAENVLWLAKDKPEGTVYGHIEKSKSGKALRFKRDKEENAPTKSFGKSPQDKEDIARAVALKAAVDYSKNIEISPDEVLENAEVFLGWLQGNTLKTSENESDKVYYGEDFDPKDLPPEFN